MGRTIQILIWFGLVAVTLEKEDGSYLTWSSREADLHHQVQATRIPVIRLVTRISVIGPCTRITVIRSGTRIPVIRSGTGQLEQLIK